MDLNIKPIISVAKNGAVSKTVEIKDILINESLQRNLRLTKLDDMIKNFRIEAIGKLVCSYRNNKYYVIDGQHRLTVLERLGYTDCECDVFYGLTTKQEAELYRLLAQTTQQSSREKFNARLQMGEKVSAEIVEYLVEKGWRIKDVKHRLNDKNLKTIDCVNSVEKCFKKDKAITNEVFDIYNDHLNSKNISKIELEGMFMFLKLALKNKNFDKRSFIKKIETLGQLGLKQKGIAQKTVTYTSASKGYALGLLMVYNGNRPEKNRLSLNIV